MDAKTLGLIAGAGASAVLLADILHAWRYMRDYYDNVAAVEAGSKATEVREPGTLTLSWRIRDGSGLYSQTLVPDADVYFESEKFEASLVTDAAFKASLDVLRSDRKHAPDPAISPVFSEVSDKISKESCIFAASGRAVLLQVRGVLRACCTAAPQRPAVGQRSRFKP